MFNKISSDRIADEQKFVITFIFFFILEKMLSKLHNIDTTIFDPAYQGLPTI